MPSVKLQQSTQMVNIEIMKTYLNGCNMLTYDIILWKQASIDTSTSVRGFLSLLSFFSLASVRYTRKKEHYLPYLNAYMQHILTKKKTREPHAGAKARLQLRFTKTSKYKKGHNSCKKEFTVISLVCTHSLYIVKL